MVDKKVTDFRKGDRVEFRCRAAVMRTTPLSVAIELDELSNISEISVPAKTLTNLSKPREMTLDERMELPVDDELVRTVERAILRMFGPDGTLDEPLDEVALSAIDAVYSRGMAEKTPEF